MRVLRSWGPVVAWIYLFALKGNSQQQSPPSFTLSVNARIVFLDVTVLDRHDRPVTQGLTKEDFVVTEDSQPQAITSFESPAERDNTSSTSGSASNTEEARTEIVLDRLNSTFLDFSYQLTALHHYLASQPAQLASPTELMLLDNTSFEMVEAYTRDRDDLLEAVDHISAALPMKLGSDWRSERLLQSISALREIAFRNEGITGRKNVLWMGDGIGVNLSGLPSSYDKLKWFSHDTTNALVNGRISLFVIAPQLRADGVDVFDLQKAGIGAVPRDDPFSADIGTAALAYQSGGSVLSEGNSPERLMKKAQTYGSNFYTLTYRPPDGPTDGRFRRVFVKMRDPKLRAVAKIGYYAQDSKAPFNARQQEMFHLTSEVQSAIPLDTLSLKLANIVRHTDTGTVELTLHLRPDGMQWQSDDQRKSHADLMLAAVSLNARRDILASRFQDLPLTAETQSPARLAALTVSVMLSLHVPKKTASVRVVLEAAEHRRAGSLDIPRSSIEAAKDVPTPAPALVPRPPASRLTAPSL